MKKVLLAVFLLLVLITISYIKTKRQHDRVDQNSAQESSAGETIIDSSMSDSLIQALEQQSVAYRDSLTRLEAAGALTKDSLAGLIASREDSISRLARQLDSARAAGSAAVKPPDAAPKRTFSHKDILTYYQEKYRELPKDLSPYERKVALEELRESTARHFSISVVELDKIRKANKLDY